MSNESPRKRCTICDLIEVASNDLEASLFHCAMMAGSWGLEDFKSTMCDDHRSKYVPALLRGAQALDTITGPPSIAHKLRAEVDAK